MIKGELKNFGFDPTKVVIKPESWKFGSNIPLKELNPSGDWSKWLPQYEAQAEFYETYGCTVYATQSQVETLLNFLYTFKEEPNYAERYNYNNVGIEPPGTDPDLVYEDIRKNGLIPQASMPVPFTLSEFKQPRPMTPEWLERGREWGFTLNHEWIQSSNPDKMKDLIVHALKYSPVALSVTAWFQDESGLYVDNESVNNHWTLCYSYRYDEKGRVVLKIFDSYDHSHKELHPDHTVLFAKRISLKVAEKDTTSIGSVLLGWMSDLINKIKSWIL